MYTIRRLVENHDTLEEIGIVIPQEIVYLDLESRGYQAPFIEGLTLNQIFDDKYIPLKQK